MVPSKDSICDTKNNTYEFKLCSISKHRPNGQWMIYGIYAVAYRPNGKGIIAPMEYIPIINSLDGKDMVL